MPAKSSIICGANGLQYGHSRDSKMGDIIPCIQLTPRNAPHCSLSLLTYVDLRFIATLNSNGLRRNPSAVGNYRMAQRRK